MSGKEVSAVRVFARFRLTRSNHSPLSGFEIDQTLHQIRLGDRNRFRFDGVLDASSTQIGTFDVVGSQSVVEVLKGFNATILAYGQTGSGKTHTMLGAGFGEGSASTQMAWDVAGDIAGMMPRVVNQLFSASAEDQRNINTSIECSMLEIYNEEIRDLLLSPSAKKKALKKNRGYLKLRETPEKGVWIENLSRTPCICTTDVLELIQVGSLARSTASTNMNAMSSRSHVVVTITTTQRRMDGSTIRAKLHLVDLAGSERVGKTAAKGSTLREAQSINQSLSALGNCMRALTTGNAKHIPFRDSKLTHLLRDSLGGNSKTTMVICLASDDENKDETMSTLRFGQRAKRIQCAASMNKSGGGMSELKAAVDALKKTVAKLERENKVLRGGGETKKQNIKEVLPAKESEIAALRVQLASAHHTLSERDATIATLETSKKEVQIYSETLLAQLNDAERKSTTTASLLASEDEKLEAARAAVESERERLNGWEAELAARRGKRQTRDAERELDLERREHELLEREREVSNQRKNEETRSTYDLVEEYELKTSEMNTRMKEADDRMKRRESEVEELRTELQNTRTRMESESERVLEREKEVEAIMTKMKSREATTEQERNAQFLQEINDLKSSQNEREREKTSRLMHDVQMKREQDELALRVEKSEARIQDLENQLLSVYYAHKDHVQNEQMRKQEKKKEQEQMRKDEELAKMYEERGSGGLSSSSMAQKDSDMYPSSSSPPPPPPPMAPSSTSSNPFDAHPVPPTSSASPTRLQQSRSQSRSESTSQVSHLQHQQGMSDHDIAMMLYQQEKDAVEAEERRRSQHGSNSRFSTPGSMQSGRNSTCMGSSSSLTSFTPSPTTYRSGGSQCSEQGTTKVLESPFRNMHEGQIVRFKSTPKSFHRCKVKLGMMRSHSRCLVIHEGNLIVLKPQKDSTAPGMACVFKQSHNLHGVRARASRKSEKEVDVVDPNGKTTYVFELERQAMLFVSDVEEHLP